MAFSAGDFNILIYNQSHSWSGMHMPMYIFDYLEHFLTCGLETGMYCAAVSFGFAHYKGVNIGSLKRTL